MIPVLCYDRIDPIGLARFDSARYAVGTDATNPQLLLMRSHRLQAEEVPSSVLAVGRAGAGVNNIPVEALTARGIPVFNTPGANANSVVELTIAAMIMAARNLPQASSYIEDLAGKMGEGTIDPATEDLDTKAEKDKSRFAGFEIAGKRLGLVGVGAIGALVAEAAFLLDMEVVGYDPHKPESDWPDVVEYMSELELVLADSDFVSLHLPINEHTAGIIGTRAINEMKPGAVLLNLARKGLVDHQSVIEALGENHLKAYVCDYLSVALFYQPNVIQLPHLGASTAESEERCAVRVVDQLREYIENGNVGDSVNFPDITEPRLTAHRLTVAHDNRPGILGRIATVIGEYHVNIADNKNAHRGDLAYTIFDIESEAKIDLIEELEGIGGVLQVRYLPDPAVLG
jgi:D-3-phosphoglycerate dehydrogenase / 2-oxoglutarate reductase